VRGRRKGKGKQRGFPLQSPPLYINIDSMRKRVRSGGKGLRSGGKGLRSGGKGLSRRLECRCGVGLPGSWYGTPLPSLGRG